VTKLLMLLKSMLKPVAFEKLWHTGRYFNLMIEDKQGWTVGNCGVLEGLVEQIEGELEQVDADGAYDTRQAFEVTAARATTLVLQPSENAVPWE
jgi:hypothetical protein